MSKRATIVFLFSVIAFSLSPSTAVSSYTRGADQMGERLASFLASPFVAAFDPAPLVSRPLGYLDESQVPPGMCRWERYVLDRNGKPVLDQYGKPQKEYAISSCLYPPN